MRWSWKLASVAGIGIYMHWTFLLLIAWVVWSYYSQSESWPATLRGVGLVLSIFVCVILHELGHALAGRRFGVNTRDITLLPIGGMARLERIPEEPMHEFVIAIAGPAVNVAIAAILFGVLLALDMTLSIAAIANVEGAFLTKLMWFNLILVAFNMLPAFPMDGGRVLRSILATSMDYARATDVAATVGQGLAICFGLVGVLLFNPLLLIIAFFVFLGAQQEAYAATMKSAMRGLPVRDAMMTRFRTLAPDDSLEEAIGELLAGSQQDFPVVDNGSVVGMLTRDGLIRALESGGRSQRVGEAMQMKCLVVDAADSLEDTFARMRERGCTSLAVTRRGEVVGLLTLENVGELMMINSAMKHIQSRSEIRELFARG